LAQKMDIDTAVNIARNVAEESNLEEFMVELLEQMWKIYSPLKSKIKTYVKCWNCQNKN